MVPNGEVLSYELHGLENQDTLIDIQDTYSCDWSQGVQKAALLCFLW